LSLGWFVAITLLILLLPLELLSFERLQGSCGWIGDGIKESGDKNLSSTQGILTDSDLITNVILVQTEKTVHLPESLGENARPLQDACQKRSERRTILPLLESGPAEFGELRILCPLGRLGNTGRKEGSESFRRFPDLA
jgi:hypothetical protein